MKKNEKNMKKQQKTDYFESTIKPSLFPGEPANPGNLLLRNEPNFNSLKFTASLCSTVVYNDLKTKPQKETNPNEPN
ncbi:MAG TPA: hypothetical protein ENH94_10460 [Phycisphaerales bacterium]|nr:hypothetical protein [Phycisphaerales bacterium]